MMKTLYTLLAVLPLLSFAQHGCDGTRYLDLSFAQIDSTKDVQFGSNYSDALSANQDLFMDVYFPKTDAVTDRPVIIMAFGGSFISGDRTMMSSLCKYYAYLGYVAATIDYRLASPLTLAFGDSSAIKTAVLNATHDMKAAIRFFKNDFANNTNSYGIDTSLIFVGGFSAGAITAVHTGFVQTVAECPADVQTILNNNGGLEGSTNNLPFTSIPVGIINFAGAIDDLSMINSGDPAIVSLQSIADETVSYYHDQPFGGQLPDAPKLYGSGVLHQPAMDRWIHSELKTIPDLSPDDNHNWFSTAYGDTAMVWSTRMMEGITCGSIDLSAKETVKLDFNMFPNPTAELLNVNGLENGLRFEIIDLNGKMVQAGTLSNGKIDVSQLRNGTYILQLESAVAKQFVKQ